MQQLYNVPICIAPICIVLGYCVRKNGGSILPDLSLMLTDRFFIAAGTIFLSGCIRGFSGFGTALLIMPVLSVLYSPIFAIMIVVLVDLIGSLQLLPTVWRLGDLRKVIPISVSAAITIPLGLMILSLVDPEIMTKIIAVMMLVSTAILAMGWRYRRQPGLPVTLATGAVTGLIGGSVGISAPPIVIFFLSGHMKRHVARASIAGCFVLIDCVAIAVFSLRDWLTLSVLWHALFFVPFFIFGVRVGVWLFPKASEATFRKIAYILLVVVGLSTLLL